MYAYVHSRQLTGFFAWVFKQYGMLKHDCLKEYEKNTMLIHDWVHSHATFIQANIIKTKLVDDSWQ